MADVEIDLSCLPPVQEVCRGFAVLEDGALAYCLQEQEIEQHYAANVQKNQLFQKDVRMARELQDLEEQASTRPASEPQEHVKERDPRAAREDIPRKAEGRPPRKEEDQQEMAEQLQDLEAGKGESRQPKQRLESWKGTRGDRIEPLNWAMAELELQGQQQLQQDEEFARKLHEEEQTRLRARRTRGRDDDYRAAQVAQDEEIARYIQDQELKMQWRSPGKDAGAKNFEEAHGSLSEPRRSHVREEARQSCAAASPIRVQSLERSEARTGGDQADVKPQLCRNIAEDLDPTFKAKRLEPPPPDELATCSQALPPPPEPACLAAAPARPVPVDGFFDYLDEVAEPTFVSPTKRQPEKVGRQKSRDKKEGCKQQ